MTTVRRVRCPPFVTAPAFLSQPRRQKPVQHEQNSCIELNGYLRLLTQRHNDLFYTHIPNGGWRAPKTAGELKAMGVREGVWDYYFRKKGSILTVWIEMKHGRNTLSPAQERWRDDMRLCGSDRFFECHSAYQALEALVLVDFLPVGSFERFGSGIRILFHNDERTHKWAL